MGKLMTKNVEIQPVIVVEGDSTKYSDDGWHDASDEEVKTYKEKTLFTGGLTYTLYSEPGDNPASPIQ